MSMEQILAAVRGLDGCCELAPTEGSEFPEIAWGDHFFYYAPDGRVPPRTQPYATIVTKDYPGDADSDLAAPDRWRCNIHVGRPTLARLVGPDPADPAAADVLFPHPVYAAQGWIAVVNPGRRTLPTVLALLHDAHQDARRRALR
jgi:hypothetical protein